MYLHNVVKPIAELQAPLESIPGRFIGRARGCIESHTAQVDAPDAPAHEKIEPKNDAQNDPEKDTPPKVGGSF